MKKGIVYIKDELIQQKVRLVFEEKHIQFLKIDDQAIELRIKQLLLQQPSFQNEYKRLQYGYLLFDGCTKEEIFEIQECLKEQCSLDDVIFIGTTIHNVEWTFVDLAKEVEEEHQTFYWLQQVKDLLKMSNQIDMATLNQEAKMKFQIVLLHAFDTIHEQPPVLSHLQHAYQVLNEVMGKLKEENHA